MFWIVYWGLGFWVPFILLGCLLVVFLGAIALNAGPAHSCACVLVERDSRPTIRPSPS